MYAAAFMTQIKTVRTHSSYFINLVAEPMEPIHAELFRLATELEAVRGQVQMECNALRDLCTDHYSHVELRFTARPETEPQGSWKTLTVNTIAPIQQNPMKNGYDENKGYDESYENKCATNYSIITNNNWSDTHNKQLTMHNKYTNDDVDFDDCVVHIMR